MSLAASWRVMTSARSSARPRVRNSQSSSRLIVVSARPVMAAVRVRTRVSSRDSPATLPGCLRRQPGSVAGLSRLLTLVRTRTAAITGLAETTMSRDDDWLFLTLGRALERADVSTRQLAASDIRAVGEGALPNVLLSCGGYEPYLRRTHGIIDPARVANFLLRDPAFPRSAFASLTVAGGCLS